MSQEAYEAALATYYNATLETLTTAAAVNSWVSDATRGKITEIASEEAVQQVGGKLRRREPALPSCCGTTARQPEPERPPINAASLSATAQAVLLLVNAVYFKGAWMSPFPE